MALGIIRFLQCFSLYNIFSYFFLQKGRSLVKTTVNQYLIPRSDLVPGQLYTVKVKINESASDSEDDMMIETSNFTYTRQPLRCVILGKQITVGWNETMVLDGRSSTDPDDIKNEATTMSWSCENTENGNPCIDSSGAALTGTGDKLELFIGEQSFPNVLVNGSFPTEQKRYFFISRTFSFYWCG